MTPKARVSNLTSQNTGRTEEGDNLCNLKQTKHGLQYRKLLVTPQTQCTGTEKIAGTAMEN